MTDLYTHPPGLLKRLLPGSLFGRALLILVLPALLMQAIAIYIFYERHWDNITRHLSTSLAGEIALITHDMETSTPLRRADLASRLRSWMGMNITFDDGLYIPLSQPPFDPLLEEFIHQLDLRLSQHFTVELSPMGDQIVLRIRLSDASMRIEVSKKRLASSTTYIFVLWVLGATLLLLAVAVIFLRNQLRPISGLADASERFGKGQDIPDFRPRGALEVRRAGVAFLGMKERIERQIRTRTQMLAGISHDLRTPLTRLRLQLALLGSAPAIEEMKGDLREMERMIQEYLDFARAEKGEEPQQVSLSAWLNEAVSRDIATGRPVTLSVEGAAAAAPPLTLRAHALRRALANLIDNALQYGTRCDIKAYILDSEVHITVDDNGPGIKPVDRERVFQPFTRLDPSRNRETGGVGLGLSIVRDIVQAHGGEVTLEDSPLGGLRAHIRLPV